MLSNSKISKAQQDAVNKYIKSNYDRINLTIPKGNKDIIKTLALSKSESLNDFINRAINKAMEIEL